jgi:Rieske Fe-S protein
MPPKLPRRALLLAPVIAAPCLCKASQSECCTVPSAPQPAVRITPDKVTLDLSQTPELRRTGGYVKIVLDQNNEIIVVHPAKNEYHALARKCTHGGGPLTYVHKQRVLHCTCWGHSQFAFDGAVVSGPAKQKLRSYSLARNGDSLEIRREPLA